MRRRGDKEQGFTLVELMVVIIIIGLLAAIAVPMVTSRIEKAKKVKAQADCRTLHDAVDMFRAEQSKWPESLTDLVNKPSNASDWPEGGYLKDLPNDPWTNEYRLLRPGPDGKPFEVVSFGPDGVEGGGDDISSIKSKKDTGTTPAPGG